MGEARKRAAAKAAETASVTVLYNGWLLVQWRVPPQGFADAMDSLDQLWPAEARGPAIAAAHLVGRTAKTQDFVVRSGAAMTLLWSVFRHSAYAGVHKDWCADSDLVVTFNETGSDGKVKTDLWAGNYLMAGVETSPADRTPIQLVDSSKFPIYRHADTDKINEELACFATGDPSSFDKSSGGPGVLGLLLRDRIDNDFGGVVLVPDELGRFRMVDCLVSRPTIEAARQELHALMRTVALVRLKPAPS